MRILVPFVLASTVVPVAASAAPPVESHTLEVAWHRCLREAYANQPAGQSRAGNERNALDECKEREDAYVKGLMAAHPQSMWARAWTAITEPLSAWIGILRR